MDRYTLARLADTLDANDHATWGVLVDALTDSGTPAHLDLAEHVRGLYDRGGLPFGQVAADVRAAIGRC